MIRLTLLMTGLMMSAIVHLPGVEPVVRLDAIPYPLEWVNQPAHYSISDTVIEITAGANTNMFRSPMGDFKVQNAPMLLFQPQADFELSATIEVTFNGHWDAGALVLYADSLNWMKFCFEKDYTDRIRVVTVVTHNYSDDSNAMLVPGNVVRFKMVKAKDVVVLSYAEPGGEWFLVRHFMFQTTTKYQVGFLTQAPVVDSCRVLFKDIRYAEQDGLNPYEGVK